MTLRAAGDDIRVLISSYSETADDSRLLRIDIESTSLKKRLIGKSLLTSYYFKLAISSICSFGESQICSKQQNQFGYMLSVCFKR